MDVRKVALVGGGVIGAGWAARLVENGIDVVMCDPDPEVERKVGEVLANADRAYAKLTMAPRGNRGSILTFTRTSRPPSPTPTSCRRARRSARTSRSRCSRGSTGRRGRT